MRPRRAPAPLLSESPHLHIHNRTLHPTQQLPPEQDARLRGATPSNASFEKDYILGRQLGSGAYAVVYECTNRVRVVFASEGLKM